MWITVNYKKFTDNLVHHFEIYDDNVDLISYISDSNNELDFIEMYKDYFINVETIIYPIQLIWTEYLSDGVKQELNNLYRCESCYIAFYSNEEQLYCNKCLTQYALCNKLPQDLINIVSSLNNNLIIDDDDD
jgi:hypothetical protein